MRKKKKSPKTVSEIVSRRKIATYHYRNNNSAKLKQHHSFMGAESLGWRPLAQRKPQRCRPGSHTATSPQPTVTETPLGAMKWRAMRLQCVTIAFAIKNFSLSFILRYYLPFWTMKNFWLSAQLTGLHSHCNAAQRASVQLATELRSGCVRTWFPS